MAVVGPTGVAHDVQDGLAGTQTAGQQASDPAVGAVAWEASAAMMTSARSPLVMSSMSGARCSIRLGMVIAATFTLTTSRPKASLSPVRISASSKSGGLPDRRMIQTLLLRQ